jgi:hypothetical protein
LGLDIVLIPYTWKKKSDENPDPLWGTFNKNKKNGRSSQGVKRPGGDTEISRIGPILRISGFSPPHPHIVIARKGTTNN